MSTRQLHPDWPATNLAAEYYSQDGPAGEIAAALDNSPKFGTATAPSGPAEAFQLSEIARVVRYRITYHDSYYYYYYCDDEEAPSDAENSSVWRPDNQISGTELQIHLVGQLTDGRWFSLVGGNDYTGWGCQDYADFRIGDTEQQVVQFGLDQAGRRALGYETPTAVQS